MEKQSINLIKKEAQEKNRGEEWKSPEHRGKIWETMIGGKIKKWNDWLKIEIPKGRREQIPK